jgi:alkylation response protein AidB-like acyl-CoA dehydrogenase
MENFQFDATAVTLVEELAYSDPAFLLGVFGTSLLLVNNSSQQNTRTKSASYREPVPEPQLAACVYERGQMRGTMSGNETNTADEGERKGWILNWTKCGSCNGTLDGHDTGDLFLVYARTGTRKVDLTQFVVEKGIEASSWAKKLRTSWECEHP